MPTKVMWHVTYTVNFKIQDGWQTAAILKSLTRHISIKKCLTLMKFGAQKWIPIKITVISRNLTISKECFGHYSAPNYLILVKFCVMMKNTDWLRLHDQDRYFRKLKMVDGRHFEKRYHNVLVAPRCDKVKINE